MAKAATRWEEPLAQRPPKNMTTGCWCYLCETAHEYEEPCRALRQYREEVVGDLAPQEVTDATH